MITPAEAVRLRLLALTSVTALVSTRVFMLKLPQGGTLPAIRVQQIGVAQFMHLRGSTQLCRARVQVDSVATEKSGVDAYASAHAVATAAHGRFVSGVATGLCGWKGQIGSPAFVVTGMLPDDEREGYDAEELQQVKVMRDYMVWYQEPAA